MRREEADYLFHRIQSIYGQKVDVLVRIAQEIEILVDNRPINMVLFCPNCGQQHIDAPEGEWKNPPHKTHLCHFCSYKWRPADVATNGVEKIQTKGEKDSPLKKAARELQNGDRWKMACGCFVEIHDGEYTTIRPCPTPGHIYGMKWVWLTNEEIYKEFRAMFPQGRYWILKNETDTSERS